MVGTVGMPRFGRLCSGCLLVCPRASGGSMHGSAAAQKFDPNPAIMRRFMSNFLSTCLHCIQFAGEAGWLSWTLYSRPRWSHPHGSRCRACPAATEASSAVPPLSVLDVTPRFHLTNARIARNLVEQGTNFSSPLPEADRAAATGSPSH